MRKGKSDDDRRPALRTTIDPVLEARLRALSEVTEVPMSRLVDRALRLLLDGHAEQGRAA